MENYGATFRTFRKNKEYTLKHVANGIVSVSFLSKFERGNSDISFSVMIELLERMTVTYEEFYFMHHAGKSNAIEEFFNTAGKAYVDRDVSTIDSLKKKELEKFQRTNHIPYHCNVLLLEVYKSMILYKEPDVADDSLQLLTNYLFDIEVWGYYELSLYNSTLFLLPAETVITFSDLIYNKSEPMKKLPLLHDVLISILLNTITYLTGGQDPHFAYKKESQTFIHYLENSEIPEKDIHARIAHMQAKAYVEIRLGKIKKGTSILQRAITIYEELGANELALQCSNYLHLMLNKQNIDPTEIGKQA